MMIFCDVPDGASENEVDPFPGSAVARKGGCSCPEKQNWPRQLIFDADCPVHQLEPVTVH